MVTIIGLGFVGLTTALGIAASGTPTFGYDIDAERVGHIKRLSLRTSEPFIHEQLRHLLGDTFFVTDELNEPVSKSDCILICVGSPCQPDGKVDLSQVIFAVNACLDCMPDDGRHRTIAIKSTVPPGTCNSIIEPLVRSRGFDDRRVSVASNPEFLREGFCWEDFMNPSRIVIGTDSKQAEQTLKSIYAPLNARLFKVSATTAEYSKYLSNVMLATMISFSNEMAHAGGVFGDVDVRAAFETLHEDSRIKNSGIASYLFPGCGFGGYCLPKDIQAFCAALQENGYSSTLLNTVTEINHRAAADICSRVEQCAEKSEPIGILGVAFKPGTDDVRDSASARIIDGLFARGYNNIFAYDPLAEDNFKRLYPNLSVSFFHSAQALVEHVNVVIIATAWNGFRLLDYTGKKLIDGRYMIGGAEA